MKTIKLMSLVAALFVAPAIVSAETVAVVPADQVVATQTGGFQTEDELAFGTLNGGFLVGAAVVAVIYLATTNDSSSGTR